MHEPEISDSGRHPSGLAVCLVEALQASIGEAKLVVERYSSYQSAQGVRADADGIRALLRTFEEVGGSEPWAGKVGNYRRRYSPQSAPVAGAAIEHAAELLYAHRIDSVEDLRHALGSAELRSALESSLREIAGHSDAWFTLLALTGLDRQLVAAGA